MASSLKKLLMGTGWRTKLILSHSLPILILLLFLGIFLLSSLHKFYVERLGDELYSNGVIIAYFLEADPALATEPARLQQIFSRLDTQIPARIQIMDAKGVVVASTEPEDAPLVGTISHEPTVQTALLGQIARLSENDQHGNIVSVSIPLARRGAIRLALESTDVETTFNRLNQLIVGGVVGLALIASAIGYLLGSGLSRSLRQLTREAHAVAQGDLSRRVEARDGDEVSQLAASFNDMTDQLAAQREMRGQLLYDISHELRRPISALQVACEVLAGRADEQHESSYPLFHGFQRELGRLTRLTDRLPFVTLDPQSPRRLERRACDLALVVQQVIELFQPEAQRRSIQLSSALPERLPVIEANEDALYEVITILLDNALKFTPQGGRVCVSAGTTQQQAWIEVSDSGMGMTPDEQARLFQRFYRGDPNRARPRGLGLGLAIAQELVQWHCGAITVISQVNRGATFRVALPLQEPTMSGA